MTPFIAGGYDQNSYARSQAIGRLREYAKKNPQDFQWRLRPWPVGVEEDSRFRLFELLSENPDNLEGGVAFSVRPVSQEALERAVDRAELIGIRWIELETISLSDLDQEAGEAGLNISTRLRTKITEMIDERERTLKRERKGYRFVMMVILGVVGTLVFLAYRSGELFP